MIKTLKAFDLKNRNIIIRVDFNVPMEGDRIQNDFRIRASLPTIETCLESGSSVVLLSHMGRPKGKYDYKLSLMVVGERLAELLEMPIKFSKDCISMDAIDTSLSLKPGEVHLLENLRFHKDEEENGKYFSNQLARHGHVFINDAFGTAHREHASNCGIASHFKNSGIGWLMDKELNYLKRYMDKPQHPVTLILGGAKVDTKLELIDSLLEKVDNILIGGGMAFTFLKAKGKSVGGSLVDNSMLQIGREIINKALVKGVKIYLPVDVFCGKSIDSKKSLGPFTISSLTHELAGYDLGPRTISIFNEILTTSSTILWNGPMGLFESECYQSGTKEIAMHLVDCVKKGSRVIIGGGDTAAAIDYLGLMNIMTHVSTGGGASLELLSGNKLPAIEALDK